MKKIIQLAKNRRKRRNDSVLQNQRGSVSVPAPNGTRRKSTFSFVSDVSSDFYGSKSDVALGFGDSEANGPNGYDVDLNSVSDKFFTKLHKASFLGNIEKVAKHIKKNDVNLQDAKNRSPLHYAVVSANADVVKYLYESNAKFTLRDGEGKTPYLKAVECKHVHLIKLLLDCGSDANTPDFNEDAAVNIGVKTGQADIVKAVLQYGGNPNHQNMSGSTALHLACTEPINPAIVYTLLVHGASVNALDNRMRTCLMLACKAGCYDVVKALLDKNANMMNQDDRGSTAEDYALMAGHHSIADLLTGGGSYINYGASPSPKSKNDQFCENLSDAGKTKFPNEVSDVELDSWESSEENSDGECLENVKLKMPPLKLDDLIQPSSDDASVKDTQAERKLSGEPDKKKDAYGKYEYQTGLGNVNDDASRKMSQPEAPKNSLDKKRMSISLGLIEDNGKNISEDENSSFDSSSEDLDADDNISNSMYIPTVADRKVISPVSNSSAPQNSLQTASGVEIPKEGAAQRLYKKHTRNSSSVSAISGSSNFSAKKSSEDRDPPSKNVSDSNWDSSDEEISDKVFNDANNKILPNESYENSEETNQSKEGTLGRFGTLAGVDEIWENNPSISQSKSDSSEEKSGKTVIVTEASEKPATCADMTNNGTIINTQPVIGSGEVNKFEIAPLPNSEIAPLPNSEIAPLPNSEIATKSDSADQSDHSSISTITCEGSGHYKPGFFSKHFNFDYEKEGKSFVEVPSKLTFRRKSLEPENNDLVSLKVKRSRFTRSASIDTSRSKDFGLLKKVSLAACDESILENELELDGKNRAGSLASDYKLDVTDSRVLRSVSPEAMAPVSKPKRRFSLAGGLKPRRKSVADWDKQNESLSQIPEDDPHENENQKKYGNRKQFRCFKVSPGQAPSDDKLRRASIAIGENKSIASTSKVVMKNINRRLSLSSPEPDVNANCSSEPTLTQHSKGLEPSEGKEEKTAIENPPSPVQKKPAMHREDLSSPSISDSDLLEQPETDYNDQTDHLSISSSEEDISEPDNQLHRHLPHENISEDMLRELRLALEKESTEKKNLQMRVRQLQRDRTRYIQKIEEDAIQMNSLNQTVVEAEAKFKLLELELIEEKDSRENVTIFLEKMKEQLSNKEHQCTEEIKLKQNALQKIKTLESELGSSLLNFEELSNYRNSVNKSADVSKVEELKNAASLLQENLDVHDQKIRRLESDKKELNDRNEKLIEKAKLDQECLEDEKNNWLRTEKELIQNNEAINQKLQEALHQCKLGEEALDKACLDYTSQRNSLTSQKEALKAKLVEANTTIDNFKIKNNELHSKLEDAEMCESQDVKIVQDKLKKMNDECSVLNTKNIELQKEILNVSKALLEEQKESKNSTRVDELRQEIIQLKISLEKLKEENIQSKLELEKKVEKTNSDLSFQDQWSHMLSMLEVEHKNLNQKFEERCISLQKTIDDLKLKLKEVERLKSNKEEECREKDEKIYNLHHEVKSLEVSIESLNVERSFVDKDVEKSDLKMKCLESSNEELKQKLAGIQSKLAETDRKLTEAEIKLKEQNFENKDDQVLAVKQLEIENGKLTERIQNLTKQLEELKAQQKNSTCEREGNIRLIQDLHSSISGLESNLSEEKAKQSFFKTEANAHQDMWQSEIKTKSLLGLRLGELENRCKQCDEDVKNAHEKIKSLENDKGNLEFKVDQEKANGLKMKETVLLLKTYLKSAKKRIKHFELEPAENRLEAFKNQLQNEKAISEHQISKLKENIKHLESEAMQREQKIKRLKGEIENLKKQLFDKEQQLKDIEVQIQYRDHPNYFNQNLHSGDNTAGTQVDRKCNYFPSHKDKSAVDKLEEYKHLIEANARRELNDQLNKLNAHLKVQSENQLKIDKMRLENESKLQEELDFTRSSMNEQLTNIKTVLEEKVDELRSAKSENNKLKSQNSGTFHLDSNNVVISEIPILLSPQRPLHDQSMLQSTLLSPPASMHPQYDPSIQMPCYNNDDNFSHLVKSQLDATIQQHLNSDPQIPFDLPDHDYTSKHSSPDHSSALERSQSKYISALKRKYFL